MKKIRIDFQEAAEELRADYIVRALSVCEGVSWKMQKTRRGVITFYALIEGEWYPMIPTPGVYFVKWEPVRCDK